MSYEIIVKGSNSGEGVTYADNPVVVGGVSDDGKLRHLRSLVDGTVYVNVAGGSVTVAPSTSTAVAHTAFAVSNANATVLVANAARKGASVFNNETAGGANLYLKLGVTATTAGGGYTVKIPPQGYYEVPFSYTGRIDGIWDAAAGTAAAVGEYT